MSAEVFQLYLSMLFYLCIILYGLRMPINWVLINLEEGTNHLNVFTINPKDLLLTVRHSIRSFTKGWWTGDSNKSLKIIVNAMTALLLLSIVMIIIGVIILRNL
jgi:hypothetical protein